MSAAARVLEEHKKPNALSLAYTRGVAEQNEKQRMLARDVAAFDRMCMPGVLAPRKPLCPTSTSNLPSRVSAGAIALRRDKVLGVYEEPRK